MKAIRLIALSSVFALSAACATNHITGTGRTIGEDPNTSYQAPMTLTSAEFIDDRRFTTTWTAWDANRDGRLDNTEFARGTFARLDVNRDGWVSRDELNTVSSLYPGYIAYETWDADRDMRISSVEFAQGTALATGAYMLWDANRDGFLSREELARGSFNAWDLNRNGTIEASEMRASDPFYRY